MRRFTLAALFVAAVCAGASAQTKIPPEQDYLFVLADKASAFQTALGEGAASGLEAVLAAGQGVLMARTPTASTWTQNPILSNISSFEKELNAAGARGFAALPSTLTKAGDQLFVIMRRAPNDANPRAYQVLERDDAFEKNMADLGSKGYSTIGVFAHLSGMAARLGRPGRLYAVLQAEAGQPVAAAQFRVVSTMRTSTLEKEINEAAAGGYRVLGSALMNVLLMKGGDGSARYSYRLIGATNGRTLAKEIRQAGQEGYRLMPSTIMGNPGTRAETVLLMERASASKSYDYDFVDANSKTAALELAILKKNGLDPVAILSPVAIGFGIEGPYNVVFEKER
jgi:hypothetical protein